jgi:hypothetical protein
VPAIGQPPYATSPLRYQTKELGLIMIIYLQLRGWAHRVVVQYAMSHRNVAGILCLTRQFGETMIPSS